MKKKDFDLFKKHVVKWRDLLGLKDWEIHIEKDNLGEDVVGNCLYDLQNRDATISIDKSFKDLTPRIIELVALHECLELLLADTRSALNTLYNEDVTDKHIHRVIRRLENALK